MNRQNNDDFESSDEENAPEPISAYDQTYGQNKVDGQAYAPSGQGGNSNQDPSQNAPSPQQPFPGATWTVQTGDPYRDMRKHRGWIVALVAVILVFILLFFGIASCSTAVKSFSLGSMGSTGDEQYYESISTDTVGIIELSGTIEYDGSVCSPEGFKEQLDTAANNSHIKAVVLRVDSGGGTAAAGEEMTTYLRDFIAETGKPVVVSSASVNASAAYMISSQASFIYTLEATSIGGIGTAMQFTDMSGFYELLGIGIDNITSSNSKDTTYGTRALTEEERAYYQAIVDQINATFVEEVAQGRNLSVERVYELATGLTFSGSDAVENQLADDLGTLDDAIDKACELAGISQCDTVYLRQSSSDLNELLDLFGVEGETEDTTDLDSLLGKLESSDELQR